MPPGGIFFLGLFVLKLAAFATMLAQVIFLGVSVALGLFNIVANLFVQAKNAVFDRLKQDEILLQNMCNELEDYLEHREYPLHLTQEHSEVNILLIDKLGGAPDSPLRWDFENKLYFALRSSLHAIKNNLEKNWYLRSEAMQKLNKIYSVIAALKTTNFGFAVFVFILLNLSIVFPLPTILVGIVIAIGFISATAHGYMAIRDMVADENRKAAIPGSIEQKAEQLKTALCKFAEAAPHVIGQRNSDFFPLKEGAIVDVQEDLFLEETNTGQERLLTPKAAKQYDLSKLEKFETPPCYNLRFIGNLK